MDNPIERSDVQSQIFSWVCRRSTAPSAPVNPSGFASWVLRFAPALRVTGAEPVEGGPD